MLFKQFAYSNQVVRLKVIFAMGTAGESTEGVCAAAKEQGSGALIHTVAGWEGALRLLFFQPTLDGSLNGCIKMTEDHSHTELK